VVLWRLAKDGMAPSTDSSKGDMMKRLFLALILALALLLTAGVGTATADPPASQASGQSAGSEQDAGAAAGTAQQEPSNENVPVRVLSPGDDGSVSQSNEASSEATAGNTNETKQDADQDQAAGSGLQAIGQSADNEQDALALAGTLQEGASNEIAPVRDLSPGDGSSASQSNDASSEATAANANETEQEADQAQAAGSGLQAIGQSAGSEQDATALSATEQEKPSNDNVSVRVLSPGDDGRVSQSNEASSEATAGNTSQTEQEADQAQAGDSCKCGSAGSQVIGQSADNEQDATALSATQQEKPSNSNVTVRVLSPGDDGSVSQSNEASSDATAANLNATKQDADQAQASGSGSQVIGQSADNEQDATALSMTEQEKPSNSNVTVRVLSPGYGGSVSQSNVASSNAEAGNTNWTAQDADQSQAGDSCKCGNAGSQVIGQAADNEQGATALSATQQEKPSNSNVSVRVLSPGDDGRVSQSNEASSEATAANLNATKQDADQAQARDSCQCGKSGSQVIGQSADNDQEAKAASLTAQTGAINENVSVRVLSPGDGGSVSQSNVASSEAKAGNTNWTGQDADQTQAAACKCGSGGLQVIGQSADNDQEAAALSATIQEKPSNSNVPVRVLSRGGDGRVSQSNEASSEATAANLNATKQDADQAQSSGSGWQVIGQSAENDQDAFALGLTLQAGASNENAPVRVLSPGDGGSVSQSNIASSDAKAGNTNWTGQDADQSQGDKKSLDRACCGTAVQAIGQRSENEQSAKALSFTAQLGHKQPCRCKDDSGIGNSNEPVRVGSPGDDGSVRQLNEASSEAKAANWNATKQDADQIQAHPCRCEAGLEIQAIGQLDKSSQFAAALAASLQLGAVNEWAPDRKKSPGRSGDLTQVGKKAAHDASGNRTMSDRSKTQVKR
jgi:hypothetical protein